MNTLPPTESYNWPQIDVNLQILVSWFEDCREAHVKYGLGAKADFHGQPPENIGAIDCSGAFRESVWVASPENRRVEFTDGSVRQLAQVKSIGFKPSTVESGKLKDGILRVAFLRQQDSLSKIGHVAMIHNAMTLESHGKVGPNRRPWTGAGWQEKAQVYVLKK